MLKLNKKFILFIVLLNIVALTLSACGKREKEEGIVAKVNGDIITQEEFDKDFEITKKIHQKNYGEDILSQEVGNNKTYEEVLKENMLEKLIIGNLIAKELEKMNITVTDGEVKDAIKTYYIDELGGEEKYKEYLKNNGFTEEFFKKELKREIMCQKHKEEFLNKINLSENEIKEYFEKNKDYLIQVRASQILVKTEEEGNKILEKLKKGEDFHSLVATESADEDSAVKGGDLGYFTRGTSLKEYRELEDIAFDLQIGEVSDLVKTELGYHIILVEDRKDSYEDLKEDIIPVIENERYIKKLSDLRDNADIEIYLEKDKDDKGN